MPTGVGSTEIDGLREWQSLVVGASHGGGAIAGRQRLDVELE
jgi:hypothetical protein